MDRGAGRRPPSRREQLIDLYTGVALAAGTVASMLLSRAAGVQFFAPEPDLTEQVAWCLAVALPLGLRRRAPLLVLITVSGFFIGLQARGVTEAQMSSLCLLLALYTAGAWSQRRTLSRVARAIVVVGMFGWLAYALSSTASGWRPGDLGDGGGPVSAATAAALYAAAANLLFFAAAWVGGDLSWEKALQQDLLERRTGELALERDENARRAVLGERLRIAREMHDVVAHHVSVMGVQAGAARVTLGSDPEATRSALAGIESSARQAVAEMHVLLGVLRRDDASPIAADRMPLRQEVAEPPPRGLGVIDTLFDGARRAGLHVDHAVVGGPLVLPDGVAISVHRILQEALTNVVRHAAATHVVSRLRRVDGILEIEVLDDGRSGASRADQGMRDRCSGSGLGIIGMRERVALYGGELEAGPRPEGGFRVRARLPLPAAITAESPVRS